METLITLQQKINNLTRQNSNGQYSERIAQLESQKVELSIAVKRVVRAEEYKWSDAEVKALNLFNRDKRFAITE